MRKTSKRLANKIRTLPDAPGVYLHKDSLGNIIYIGKAVSLKSRVRQYFNSQDAFDAKTRSLVSNISTFDFLVTKTEDEALLLENELIKKYLPKFNVLLRDDKSYPYIKVTMGEQFPRVFKTRNVKNDGSLYFGPYANVKAVNETLAMINNIYALKRCSDVSFAADHKPCLNYHIGACKGYCLYAAAREDFTGKENLATDYAKTLGEVIAFLEGKNKNVTREIEEEMMESARKLNFERSAKLRDGLEMMKQVSERKRNLKYVLRTELKKLGEKKEAEKKIAGELQTLLKLKTKKSLYRIESYDLSNTGGKNAVGSMVVFYGLDRVSRDYRKFAIRGESGNDDTGNMQEIIYRRLKNYAEGNKSFEVLPDIIFVDGGKGQVMAAQKIVSAFKLKIPVVGMVKDDKHRTRSLVLKPAARFVEIDLKKHAGLFHYIGKIQEEVHRFTIAFHKLRRSKATFK
jgi:excinuclease UvrABC nuclease subunit